MPINDDLSTEYRIPEDIKKKIPEYFYQAFFGELISVYGFRYLVRINEYILGKEQIKNFLINKNRTYG